MVSNYDAIPLFLTVRDRTRIGSWGITPLAFQHGPGVELGPVSLQLPPSCRQLQNIHLGSAAANALSRSRNQRADEDG